ncbi:elongation factor P maturation arginine rhamnosyltransferase EarP [Ideonella livida]|uniref:Protein-arginine rhamnosyltransferase n=1 Tax=Ideonella livida TaxID=2707176 RepID=A0A7C9THM2_9BURK|nr:elongation factor P maturation arginine rhamnosyltransferase EarP [Ideonella livida]NDY89784.1 elongation factor P maturation arginine rhamnosyltransferase EarP [Ideonella livida]
MPDAAPASPPLPSPTAPRPWDLFCRVIDNFGDIGVCWRLAADLADRGQPVRLWVDDPGALAWMAPGGHPGVRVGRWDAHTCWPAPGAVVVEAFGCDPPTEFVAAMDRQRAQGHPPVWINLEYLSAEDYVERSHRLPSPQWRPPAQGLVKWFFYPGFTPATGGLLREPGLLSRLAAAPPPWQQAGATPRPGETVVSLFCYPHAPLAELPTLLGLQSQPVLLLLTPGAATRAWPQAWPDGPPPGWRVHPLPWLTQPDFDRLLAACDLNLVRGEDSFVRAQWAGRPMLWHIYAQDDGAHAAKLDAFLDLLTRDAPPALADAVRHLHHRWNGMPTGGVWAPPALQDWQTLARSWRSRLALQDDLTSQLLRFVTQSG